MRILFLSQVLPYPVDAGPKMRSYYTIRHLAQEHQVTLLTFVRDEDKPTYVEHLAQYCKAVHTVPMHRTRWQDAKFLMQSLITSQSFLIARDQISAMTAKLNRLLETEPFDVVHVDQLWMASYGLIAKKHKPHLKTILDQHNAVYLIPQRLANEERNLLKRQLLQRETKVLTRYESEICRDYDHVVWVTEEDRQAVASLPTANLAPTTVIPICADPSQVKPLAISNDSWQITFLGSLHWPPNAQGIVWFANEVFPKIRATVPQAHLTVIGKNPPAALKGEGIEVTGYVAELEPLLANTAVFIVPLHAGGGMRVKILDAWGWGLPLVSTSIGAEGITIEPEYNILIADNAPDFAQAVIRLLQDRPFAQQLGQNGRESVLTHYNWRQRYQAWNSIYQRLV